jgi:hypothetical protein
MRDLESVGEWISTGVVSAFNTVYLVQFRFFRSAYAHWYYYDKISLWFVFLAPNRYLAIGVT